LRKQVDSDDQHRIAIAHGRDRAAAEKVGFSPLRKGFILCFIIMLYLMRLFFATDFHGSETCFRKFIAAARFYDCSALFLGGDLAGKALVPIWKKNPSTWQSITHRKVVEMNTRGEVQEFEKRMAAIGNYTAVFNEDEYQQLTSTQRTAILVRLICRRMADWLDFAADRLKNTDIKIFAIAGNDDPPDLDNLLRSSSVLAFADGSIVELGGDLQVLGYGFSTPTPWHTYREQTDPEMKLALERLSGFLDHEKGTIFHLHAPPFGSGLDLAPKLDMELRPIMSSSGPVMEPVGSQAVADLIKECQPLIGLFGHVHESRSVTCLGKTLCANPGSAYSEGRLLGFITEIANQKVIDWQLTEG